MAVPPRTRKRVHAIRRAPDGSAFQNCICCGILVPVALADMHECGMKMEMKKFKGVGGKKPNEIRQSYGDQVRSPFRFFMESFLKICKDETFIDSDRKGFERWKSMTEKERQPYVIKANMVNGAHEKALVEEVNNMIKVDDEGDSAIVHEFQKFSEDYEDYEHSDRFESFCPGKLESLNTYEREMVHSWIIGSSWRS